MNVLVFLVPLALLLGALLALAVPALAAAAEFEVNGTGDSGEAAAKVACETGVGECTLRAAIADANEQPVPWVLTVSTRAAASS